MVSCGQAGTAAVYGGLFLGFANLIAALLCNFGVPILQLLLVLNACGIMETPVDFSALTKGIAKWGRWLLTFCATVFGTLLTLQSVFAQSTDTLALKTGKFLLSSSIPVVGKAVSDALSLIHIYQAARNDGSCRRHFEECGERFPQKSGWTDAVSYTHLDVYKRQILQAARKGAKMLL